DVAGLYTSINNARPEYVANTTFVSTDDSAANETAESITNSARSADRLDALRTIRVVNMLLPPRKVGYSWRADGRLAPSCFDAGESGWLYIIVRGRRCCRRPAGIRAMAETGKRGCAPADAGSRGCWFHVLVYGLEVIHFRGIPSQRRFPCCEQFGSVTQWPLSCALGSSLASLSIGSVTRSSPPRLPSP